MSEFEPDIIEAATLAVDDIKAHGYAFAKQLPSGEWLGVQKMLYTTGLFVITADGGSWRTRYCYQHSIDAILACMDWDGSGDPPGPWLKQKPEERHGPGHSP